MVNLVNDFLEKLSKNDKRIIIYGTGGLARMISTLIIDKGGKIFAYAVDDFYYTSGNNKIGSVDIFPLSEIARMNEDYVLVVGFEGDYIEKTNMAGIPQSAIVAADFLGYMATIGEEGSFSDFYKENEDSFLKTRDLFCDEESEKAFDLFLEQKTTGKYAKEYVAGDQYFDDKIMGENLVEDEIFVDCGAFQGETAISFLHFLSEHHIDSYGKIIEIEPDEVNISILKENLKSLDSVDCVKAGVYDKTGKLCFSSGNGSSSKISEEGTTIDVIAIDDYVKDEKVTFIKMDIEGSEMNALRGARKTIEKNHPKLAICVYHKYDDLISIPQFINSLNMNYKFYLRSYSRCGVETVLYAI